MRTYVLTCLLTVTSCTLFAQNKDTWIAIENKERTLIGYKDKNGVVKIKPKYMGMTYAKKFDDIMVVTEEQDAKWKSHYLTKSGRVVGRDSLYIFDNTPDCESEGFIRFTDKKTDKTGMFNSKGNIVIPAEYNALSKVDNGLIMALKDAKKEDLGDGHFSWAGGYQSLIDTTNKEVIDNFMYTSNLHFPSVIIEDKETTDSNRVSFKGANNKYYSFINLDREFDNWVKGALLPNLTKETLLNATAKDVYLWKDNGKKEDGWGSVAKAKFIEANFELLKAKLLQLTNPEFAYQTFDNGLNPLIYTSPEYQKYFNNCGEAKELDYPVKTIVINLPDEKQSQDHFDFLRTENGYQLVSVTLGTDKLK